MIVLPTQSATTVRITQGLSGWCLLNGDHMHATVSSDSSLPGMPDVARPNPKGAIEAVEAVLVRSSPPLHSRNTMPSLVTILVMFNLVCLVSFPAMLQG